MGGTGKGGGGATERQPDSKDKSSQIDPLEVDKGGQD